MTPIFYNWTAPFPTYSTKPNSRIPAPFYSPKSQKKYYYSWVVTNKLFSFVQKTAIEGFIDVDDPDADDVLQKIEEGSVYEIYKFKPDGSRDQYRTVDHKVRIQLTASTEITKVIDDNATFPLRYFDFKPLKTIGTTIKGAKTIVGKYLHNIIKHIVNTSHL